MQRYYIIFIYARKPYDFLDSSIKKATFKACFASLAISSYDGLTILRQAEREPHFFKSIAEMVTQRVMQIAASYETPKDVLVSSQRKRCEHEDAIILVDQQRKRGLKQSVIAKLTLEDCILLDAVQNGHRLNENDAKNLLERGLVEGEYPNLTISLSIARQTKQLPEYTKVKGLERDKIKQMALQFIQNVGEESEKRNSLMDYLKDVLPRSNSQVQNLRLLRNILSEINTEGSIVLRGKLWLACK